MQREWSVVGSNKFFSYKKGVARIDQKPLEFGISFHPLLDVHGVGFFAAAAGFGAAATLAADLER